MRVLVIIIYQYPVGRHLAYNAILLILNNSQEMNL